MIVTSDHGELFERGIHGHSTPVLVEPVIRVPLIISSPKQQSRVDIHSLTSNVDILPTLLKIAGLPIPDWCQGQILPGLGDEESPDRSIFVVEAKKNPAYSPLKKASVALLKGHYKMVHYFGYRHYDNHYELYDLKNDPDELNNIYPNHPLSHEYKIELDNKRMEADRPYLVE